MLVSPPPLPHRCLFFWFNTFALSLAKPSCCFSGTKPCLFFVTTPLPSCLHRSLAFLGHNPPCRFAHPLCLFWGTTPLPVLAPLSPFWRGGRGGWAPPLFFLWNVPLPSPPLPFLLCQSFHLPLLAIAPLVLLLPFVAKTHSLVNYCTRKHSAPSLFFGTALLVCQHTYTHVFRFFLKKAPLVLILAPPSLPFFDATSMLVVLAPPPWFFGEQFSLPVFGKTSVAFFGTTQRVFFFCANGFACFFGTTALVFRAAHFAFFLARLVACFLAPPVACSSEQHSFWSFGKHTRC